MFNSSFSYRIAVALVLTLFPLIAISQNDFWESTNLTTGEIRVMAKKPDGTLFAGRDGLFRSIDNGQTWNEITSLPNNYIVSMFIKSNDEVYVGTDDGIYRSSNNGNTWLPAGLQGKRILAIVVHPNGSFIAGTGPSNGTIYRSTDAGATWVDIVNLNRVIRRYGGIINQLTVDDNGQIFLGTYLGGCWASKDGGGKWSKLSLPKFNAASILFNTDGDLLANVGHLGGRIYRSSNNGRIWKRIDNKVIQSSVTSSIDINGTIFASTWGSGIYQGTSHGVTWNKINSGLPSLNIPAIALTNDGFLLVGTDANGIFRSQTPVIGIPSPQTAQFLESNMPLFFSLEQNYPNPFNPNTTIEFSIPKKDFVTLTIYNSLGENIATILSEELDAGFYTSEWDASGFASGVYFCHLVAGSYTETRKLTLLR